MQPMGSGPFMLDSCQKGEQIVLKKNPYYWEKDADGNQLPYLDQVNVLILSRRQHAHAQATGGRNRRPSTCHTTSSRR